MGYAMASAAVEFGAEVFLISGPTCLEAPEGLSHVSVQSAQQMFDAVQHQLAQQKIDVFIGVAAVTDYRPREVLRQKLKKSAETLTLELVKNPDILASVSTLNQNRPFCIGFAAETENLEANARTKLDAKQLDMIIANNVSEPGVGFGADQNRVLLITASQTLDLGKQDKRALAQSILTTLQTHLK